jgi:methionyl-tRNA synthetase
MQQKILITSALLYANGKLHLGHLAGAYLPADIFARFSRLNGDDVHYISGSDEYGVAITLSAEKEKRTPKKHVDHYHKLNQHLFEQLGFSFDHYSRTTAKEHAPLVQEFFLQLDKNGYIEKKETHQLFSPKENRFLADRYVVGTCPYCGFENARGDECPKCAKTFEATELKAPRSKQTNSPLVLKETIHWFLRFDLLKDKIKAFINTKSWKPNVVAFVQNYIEHLKARSITRDMEWGVPLPIPNTQGKVFYVWFDAPIGYISASKEWAFLKNDPELWKSYWLDPKTKLVHFIGKDNIAFHAIFFPGMIIGQNTPYKLVDDLPANEFLNLEGKQFSKSEGWYIDLNDLLKDFSQDQIRFYLAAIAPENSDSEFILKEFQHTCNADLVGKIGNFANRVLVFCQNEATGHVPLCQMHPEDDAFLDDAKALVDEITHLYKTYKVRKAVEKILELASRGNQYFDHKKPWQDAKETETEKRMLTTLYCCLEMLKMLCVVLSPIIPQACQKLWELLGNHSQLENELLEQVLATPLKVSQELPAPKPLFTKIEDAMIEKYTATLQEKETNEQITFEDFKKVQIKVGKVIECKKVEKSNKLLHLQVDLKNEVRSIVSGIAQYYAPEDLLGKHVLVVANLKPAKLMGITSEGMLLCSSHNDKLHVSFVDLPVGTLLE